MNYKPIVLEKPINFGDCFPNYKDIILDVFDEIYKYEQLTEPIEPNEYFQVCTSRCETDGDFDGAFITCAAGSYMLHDLQQEQYEDGVITILFYNLSKIYNK